MTDPRIAAVEDNLLAFMAALVVLPPLVREPWEDVRRVTPTWRSRCSTRSRAPASHRAPRPERTREVVAAYVDRGLPFLWWTTPSTTSPELEEVLAGAGLQREDTPGMHVTLGGPIGEPLPRGVELLEVDVREETEPFLTTLLEAFGMPPELHEHWATVLRAVDGAALVNVLATLDGRPVATGTGWLTGSTLGLYNIATLPDARGRGIGRAVTARLMDLGAERGSAEAVLHASEEGRPVYERLGFVEVCTVPQHVWLPHD